MQRVFGGLFAALLVSAALAAMLGRPAGARDETAGEPASLQELIESWPETSRKAAVAMVDKYGEPDESTELMLVWHENGPWKRTIVFRDEVEHHFPVKHVDVIEQTVSYRVAPEKFDELAQFSGSVLADRTRGELSARCDREEMNMLALNLADELLRGKRGVDESRRLMARAALLEMTGKTTELSQRLNFGPSRSGGDADAPLTLEEASDESEVETQEP